MSRGEAPNTDPLHAPHEIQVLHERFVELSRQVNALLTSRTVLFAGLSHDLRSPLARINLGLEMLRDTPSPTLIEKLQSDVEHMNALIGQVMELAKGLEHDPSVAVHWRDWLSQLINQENWGPRVQLNFDSNIPDSVTLAPVALQRAIVNLVRNAIQYDTHHSPIEIRSEWVQQALNVSVLDRGPGIPKDKIETMLRPFERMDSARTPAGKGGHGLGLAIVQALARHHDWDLQIHPRPEGGLIVNLNRVGH
jgi:two-component system osmolarity sensor histidine kinase EnvZ